jgi:hypothetical protein
MTCATTGLGELRTAFAVGLFRHPRRRPSHSWPCSEALAPKFPSSRSAVSGLVEELANG